MCTYTSTSTTPETGCLASPSALSSSKLKAVVSTTDGCFPSAYSELITAFEQCTVESRSTKTRLPWSERLRGLHLCRSSRSRAGRVARDIDGQCADMLRRNSARRVHPMPLECPVSARQTAWCDASAQRHLTATQQALVRSSWRVLAADLEAYGLSMTSRILELQPSAYALFRLGGTASCTLLRTHAVRMMETFGMVVEGLNDMDTVWPLLCMLGKHHAKSGIGPEHLQAVSASLLWVLERALKDRWTSETRKAWCTLFGLVEAGILSGLLSQQLVTSTIPTPRLSSSTRDAFIIPETARRSSSSSSHSSSSSRSSTPVSMETGRYSPQAQEFSGRWATPAELTPGRWSLRTNRVPFGASRGCRLRRTLTLADSFVNNRQALQRSFSNKV